LSSLFNRYTASLPTCAARLEAAGEDTEFARKAGAKAGGANHHDSADDSRDQAIFEGGYGTLVGFHFDPQFDEFDHLTCLSLSTKEPSLCSPRASLVISNKIEPSYFISAKYISERFNIMKILSIYYILKTVSRKSNTLSDTLACFNLRISL